ncbi:hypothetical protein COB55_05405 [Candidatus Wolfebacteria bacterium]|nr:MAG: hypothetical protein COB55_05405 [Candidatus Wolfebacteria bacterium]
MLRQISVAHLEHRGKDMEQVITSGQGNSGFLGNPRTFEEATRYCELLAASSFVPKTYQGRVPDIMVALQMGAELGLKPMQALQNISVINSRPALWGDAMLALVKQHPEFEWIKETIGDDNAQCVVKRQGEPAHTVEYSTTGSTQIRPIITYNGYLTNQYRYAAHAISISYDGIRLGILLRSII